MGLQWPAQEGWCSYMGLVGDFNSQFKVESSNTKEKFESGLEYSLYSFPPPHTGHLPDCLHLIHMIPRQVCKTT